MKKVYWKIWHKYEDVSKGLESKLKAEINGEPSE
jgi:hypothetical protein